MGGNNFHKGSPFRIALTVQGSDYNYEQHILLDHIPHNDNPAKSIVFTDPSTYGQYQINVEIPDIKCEKCALQLLMVMTDKITPNTSCTYEPNCTTCTTPGTCFSNYHSCANIVIDGSTPIDKWNYTYTPPAQWPFTQPTHVYDQESAAWADSWLIWEGESQRSNSPCFQLDSSSKTVDDDEDDRIDDLEDEVAWLGGLTIVLCVVLFLLVIFIPLVALFFYCKVKRVNGGDSHLLMEDG
eukprot:TRINITY_DN2316_c0_g1_i1.p1 TRINITY_DN2316_c0_g1~~TRINITY_DN2316_c0_g1_i1.p1  ORF type:complete len:240 (+),score=40.99 TRINITY_DN2316_c0_g1_i1:255-974(+)